MYQRERDTEIGQLPIHLRIETEAGGKPRLCPNKQAIQALRPQSTIQPELAHQAQLAAGQRKSLGGGDIERAAFHTGPEQVTHADGDRRELPQVVQQRILHVERIARLAISLQIESLSFYLDAFGS